MGIEAETLSLAKKFTNSVALNGVPVKGPQIDPVTKHWKVFDPMGNAYVDTGVVAAGGAAPVLSYSTVEQATGRTDETGKPTFEITVVGTTGSAANTWNNVGNPIAGINYPVRIVRAYCKNAAGSTIWHGTITTGATFCVTIDSTGHVQEYHETTQFSSEPCVATIEYTKK